MSENIIRVVKRENPFAQIDRYPINHDNRMSWKALGLLTYLLDKPDHWQVKVKDLVNRKKDGEKAVRSGLKELEELGYITRHQERLEDGTWGPVTYMVYERPMISPDTQKGDAVESHSYQGFSPHPQKGKADRLPKNGKPINGMPKSGNLSNTDYSNTEKDDDDKYIYRESIQESLFKEKAQFWNLDKRLIYEILREIGNPNQYLPKALDFTFQICCEKFKSGDLSHLPSYFSTVLKNKQAELDYDFPLKEIQDGIEEIAASKVSFPFYNWLEEEPYE